MFFSFTPPQYFVTLDMIRIENCDNLDLMKSLPNNHIDLIYCDILYGTGRNFGDYQDLKPIRSEIEAHYIPRIKEMHRILKDTGSIYLQMDCNIDYIIRLICENILKFQASIYWKRNYNTASSKKLSNKIPNNTDVIYQFSKTNNFFHKHIERPYSESGLKRYNKTDDKGIYSLQPLVTYSQKKYDLLESKGELVISEKSKYPLYKKYLSGGVIIDNFWGDIGRVGNGLSLYPTQKPKSLIERIIKASSKEGDLVADFYMGSGTTAEVCQDLNRNFIGCDINPNAVKITNERLDKARNLFSNCG